MTKRKAQAVSEAASTTKLQAQLAEVESELTTALAVQDHATQASIWAYNSMVVSDAFIARSEHDLFVKRLEQLSQDADDVKAQSDALVRRLRDSKRELTKQLGSNVNDKQTSAERERVEKSAAAKAEAMVKSQPTQAQSRAKLKTKTELVAEAKKQAASKKKSA